MANINNLKDIILHKVPVDREERSINTKETKCVMIFQLGLSYLEFSVELKDMALPSFSHRSSKLSLKDLSYSARHENWAVVPFKIRRSFGGPAILVGSSK